MAITRGGGFLSLPEGVFAVPRISMRLRDRGTVHPLFIPA
jgi:hypothetical protein